MAKILFIVDGFPSEKSYANIFIKNQILAIKSAGFEVGIFLINMRSIRKIRKFGFYKKNADDIPIYTLSLPWGPLFKGLGLKLFTNLSVIAYKKIQKDFGKPDLLHAHFGEMGLIGAGIKKKNNIPLVITEHGSNMLPGKTTQKHKLLILNEAYKISDSLIAVSSNLANHIKDLGSADVNVIPNFIPNYFFDNVNQNNTIKKKQFISVGNLYPNKRFDLLISAFARASEKIEDMSLVIIGNGPCHNDLVKLINIKKLESKVKLYDFVSNAELPKFYRESICFISLSEYETFGVAFAEALASGIPVIATKCGGPEEFVSENNGILIPTNDEDAAVNSLIFMYNNHSSFSSRLISDDIKARFSQEIFINNISSIYNSLLNSSFQNTHKI